MTTTKKKIMLYTFPPVPNSNSICPFALKVESFLRINDIPYETCYTSSFGKNGTIPYLRMFETTGDNSDSNESLTFEELSDSNESIAFLLNDPDFDTTKCNQNSLTKEQKAIEHACLRMLEEHTAQTGFYFRYALNMPEFCDATELRDRLFNGNENPQGSLIFTMFKKGLPNSWMIKAKARGFVRYSSPDVVWKMAGDDLQALEDLLSSKDYFFGRSHPGIMDCTVFGHLSQLLYIRMDFPQQKYLKENCPGLLRFMEHFKQTHFPDWEERCQKQPNEGLSANSPRMQKIVIANKLKRAKIMMTVSMVAMVGAAVCYFGTKPSGGQEL